MSDRPRRLVLHIEKPQDQNEIQQVERADSSAEDFEPSYRARVFLLFMAVALVLGYGFGFLVGAISFLGLVLPLLFLALVLLFVFGRMN